MIRHGDHAEFQLVRRGIDKAWVEHTLNEPDLIERHERRTSRLKCLEGRRVMLRVLTPADDPTYVITAYFDRRKLCG